MGRGRDLILEDRLMLLSLLAQDLGWASVAVVNRRLYFEQARVFRSLLGKKRAFPFIPAVIGFANGMREWTLIIPFGAGILCVLAGNQR